MSRWEQPAILSHNPLGYWEVRLVWTSSAGAQWLGWPNAPIWQFMGRLVWGLSVGMAHEPHMASRSPAAWLRFNHTVASEFQRAASALQTSVGVTFAVVQSK